ncbi:MAG TPA: aminodeoxychorismate synthase component I [Pyrinomonadaceae bacterium]|jgi:para-aminobenzoate synthetase/4-amino-4-deoxychorismate lyase|nr:aminodeoxychorismate synthase component I [Pyrinomonadaceae bacterium]
MPKVIFGGNSSTDLSAEWRYNSDSPTEELYASTRADILPLLQHVEAAANSNSFAVVFLSYEVAPVFDPALVTHYPGTFPLAWAGIFSASDQPRETRGGTYETGAWQPLISRDNYDECVGKIRDSIAQGDTYQVNFTFPMVCDFSGDPFEWYRDLCKAQQAPYSAYLDLGRFKVLSLSPELFFKRAGDRVVTRPMKGTARRGRWLSEDEEIARALSQSEKDRAENVMIVDLLRNDLGRIAQPGTVKVTSLFELERYDTLWQLTSTIESTLKPNTSLVEVLSNLFPCGSITGAPKVSTMEIIHRLETFPRELFTGTIGLVRPGGDCCFNVAIRTVLVDESSGRARFGVGGGITYDSTAEGEYEECLTKAAFLTRRASDFDLIETMLLEDGEYFLLDRHTRRMRDSAYYFWGTSTENAGAALAETAKTHPGGRWKVRLLFSRRGEIDIQVTPLPEVSTGDVKVTLASCPVDQRDRFLFHKTTNRSVYEQALAEKGKCDDVILWNQVGEVTESSIANVVVDLNGVLYTPPRSAGLLAGTFREELLQQGVISERTLLKEDLQKADALFLVNSVQKWRRATLHS